MHAQKIAIMFFMLFSLIACSKTPSDVAIKEVIAKLQTALEEGVRRDFSRHIHANYHDNHGNDKAALNNIVRAYMLSHQRPKILVKVISIEAKSSDVYLVKLTALFGAARKQSGFNADLKTIEAEFIHDGGDYQVLSANWKR